MIGPCEIDLRRQWILTHYVTARALEHLRHSDPQVRATAFNIGIDAGTIQGN